jgi:alkanesulfonate monooxygenase SsuD/methylene tetrahydromethanopterin reductase-like flavin-dependent oxidoreductase (luciferase family)
LDFGVARASLDDEAHRVFGIPREQADDRFQEALDVILAAWTRESLAHSGRHFQFPEVAVSPRPLQRPHPPVFVVAVSDTRLEWAARRGHGAVIGALRQPQAVADAVARFRAQRAAAGHDPEGAELQVNRFVHVAETDEQARDSLRASFTEFMEHRAPDLRAALEATYGSLPSFERMVDDFLLVGSPETVAERLRELRDDAGVRSLLATFTFVTMPLDRCLHSMELFGRAVIPVLTPATGPIAVTRG